MLLNVHDAGHPAMHPLLTLTRKVLHTGNLLWFLILGPSVYSKNTLVLGYTEQTIQGVHFMAGLLYSFLYMALSTVTDS